MNSKTQENPSAPVGAVVVGGGPAGIALLLAARRSGWLKNLLAANVRIIERTSVVGPGEIGNYAIRSDSLADMFLKPVDTEADPPLHRLLKLSAGGRIDARRGKSVDLTTVADFLADLAAELRDQLQISGMDPFMTGLEAIRADRQGDGSWLTTCRRSGGAKVAFHSRALVLATGAHQPVGRLHEELVAGVPLLPRFARKTVQSGEFLGRAGPQKAADLLGGRRSAKVAIVGGSHSAIASACVCLHGPAGISVRPKSVAVLHLEDLRLTYDSPAEALADGYDAFGPADICARTGRVFPLSGFRSEARDLLRRYWGLGGLEPDDRLHLLRLEESRFEEANEILEEADLIVAALGYRPRALPLFGEDDEPLHLLCESGAGSLVDTRSRVLDAERCPVPGVFGVGLAAGYPYAGIYGEASFRTQANSLPLWQSDIGGDIVSQLLECVGSR